MKPDPHMLPSGRYVGCEVLEIAEDPQNITLIATLAFAVPLWMLELQDRTDNQRAAIAKRCSAMVAERGDVLMFGSKTRGKAAEVFNALAEGIAAAAFQPGGITFAGRHWCIDHAVCQEAAACAAKTPGPVSAVAPALVPQRLIADVALTESAREVL